MKVTLEDVTLKKGSLQTDNGKNDKNFKHLSVGKK